MLHDTVVSEVSVSVCETVFRFPAGIDDASKAVFTNAPRPNATLRLHQMVGGQSFLLT